MTGPGMIQLMRVQMAGLMAESMAGSMAGLMAESMAGLCDPCSFPDGNAVILNSVT